MEEKSHTKAAIDVYRQCRKGFPEGAEGGDRRKLCSLAKPIGEFESEI